MKKIFVLSMLLITTIVSAQEDSKKPETNNVQRLNEVKLNGLYMVAGAFEATYERILDEETGLGVSVMLPISSNVSDDLQYYISPYFRKYFGSKYASGFFVEAFGMLNSSDRSELFVNSDEFVTDFALGIGIGGKWITKGGFIAELNLGFGRNLFNNEDNLTNTVGKAGITIGYRF